MTTVRKGTMGLGFMVGAVFAAAGLADERDFIVRLNEAREAVFSGPGKDYFDGSFSRAFYAQYPARLSECMERTGDAEPAGFDMLLQLAANGRVRSAEVKPESAVATCYRDLTKKDVFPAPPSPGFRVPVSIRFTKQ